MAKHIIRNLPRLLIINHTHSTVLHNNCIQRTDRRLFAPQRTFVNLLHASCEELDNQTIGVLDYDAFLKENRTGPTATKNALVELLHVSRDRVIIAMKNYPLLKELSRRQLLDNYQILCNKGVNKANIREYIGLLAHNLDELNEKLTLIEKIDIDINSSILFLKLPINELKAFITNSEQESECNSPSYKIKYFSDVLEADTADICKFLIKCKQLRTQPKEVLEQKMKLFLDSGFTQSDILNDGWIFNYKYETIKEKVEFLYENDLHVRKTWLIRCSLDKLQELCKTAREQREILGDNSTVSAFIAKKLNCDKLRVEYMLFKNPTIASTSIKKISEILNLLCENGYTADQIITASHLFHRSPESLKERMKKMKRAGVLPSRLSFLSISNKRFNDYLRNPENNCT